MHPQLESEADLEQMFKSLRHFKDSEEDPKQISSRTYLL